MEKRISDNIKEMMQMEKEDIENMDEIADKMKELVGYIYEVLGDIVLSIQNYLEDVPDNPIRNCPRCNYEIDPIEIDVIPKTYEEFLEYAKSRNLDLNEIIKKFPEDIVEKVLEIILTIKVKKQIVPVGGIQEQLAQIKPAMNAIDGIIDVMNRYKKYLDDNKVEPDITPEFQTLVQIDEILRKNFS